MNPEQIARRDAQLEAHRQREAEAFAVTMREANHAVRKGRMRAGAGGGLIGFLVALAAWPIMHNKGN